MRSERQRGKQIDWLATLQGGNASERCCAVHGRRERRDTRACPVALSVDERERGTVCISAGLRLSDGVDRWRVIKSECLRMPWLKQLRKRPRGVLQVIQSVRATKVQRHRLRI